MSEIKRYFIDYDEGERYEDERGCYVDYNDHVTDKSAALAEKDREIRRLEIRCVELAGEKDAEIERLKYDQKSLIAEKDRVIKLMAKKLSVRVCPWYYPDFKPNSSGCDGTCSNIEMMSQCCIEHFTAKAREGQPERKEETCKWTWDSEYDVWNMGCGKRIAAEDCGYKFFKFCPSCAKKIEKEGKQ